MTATRTMAALLCALWSAPAAANAVAHAQTSAPQTPPAPIPPAPSPSSASPATPAFPALPARSDLRSAAREEIEQLKESLSTARDQAKKAKNQGMGLLPGCSGPERTERFSRKLMLARDGSVAVANISGDIVVTGGPGDEVSIEAVKRTHCAASQLAEVQIVVDDRAGRVDIRTDISRMRLGVSVDYTITVPAAASVDLHSVSGSLRLTGVRGAGRAETVSGDITTSNASRLELAKSVSGDLDLSGTSEAGDLNVSTVSGDVQARGVKARSLTISSVTGDVALTDVTTDRLAAKTLSGDLRYSGALARGGRYELTTYSGELRLTPASNTGFDLDAKTFSGSIRSELPLTLPADIRARGLKNSLAHATFGDGSAALSVHTFSGDIVITK